MSKTKARDRFPTDRCKAVPLLQFFAWQFFVCASVV